MDSLPATGRVTNGGDAAHRWTFFSNHFRVLASVAGKPDLRVRDIAVLVGITVVPRTEAVAARIPR